MRGAAILTEGTDPVSDSLRRWAAEPFAYGRSDCGLSVLDHVARASGCEVKPRPRYRSALGAALYCARRGGMARALGALIEPIGCTVTEQPERGDVGIVDLPGIGLTTVLCVAGGNPPRWAARGSAEVFVVPGAAVKAWRLPCRNS